MTSITIITIVVIALLTLIIFGLIGLAYRACLKLYKLELAQGLHDDQFEQDEHLSKKKKIAGRIELVGSYLVLLLLLGLFFTGLIYKINGENFTLNNKTILVIKSNSMADFYNNEIASKYNYDSSLQFSVGDICVFETNFELVEGEVYGYRSKDNIIVTHRLVSIYDNMCEFRGDNNPVSDGLVLKENIVYHYSGKKIKGLGSFVLFAQSYFGIWALIGIIGVTVFSEIADHNVNVLNNERKLQLIEEKKQAEKERLASQEKATNLDNTNEKPEETQQYNIQDDILIIDEVENEE